MGDNDKIEVATDNEDSNKSNSRKGESAKNAGKGKDIAPASSSKNRSKPKTDSSVDLASVMATGFASLENMLKECFAYGEEEIPEGIEDSGNSNNTLEASSEVPDNAGSDIFQELYEQVGSEDKVGPEVSQSLSSYADRVLKSKLSESDMKEKEEKYARPQNIEFLQAPKVNKAIWNNLVQAKSTDVQLQAIQRQFLLSSIPVIKVMEELNAAVGNPELFDPKKLIRTLGDSLAITGTANVNMVKLRKDFIKKELPKNMEALCGEGVDFSGSLLFGDNLTSSIKEVSELNKVSRGFANRRGYVRGRGFVRGRGRFMRRPGRGLKRYTPYNRNTSTSSSTYKPLNQKRPSNKN